MDIQKYLCNNCGNYGHLFYNCRKPITSFGIVCYRINPIKQNDIEYLLVQRKDSLGYVDFLRGKYNEKNLFQLKNIIQEMTITEKENILNHTYSELWDKLWNKVNDKYDIKNEEKYNYIKKNHISLFDSIEWTEPEWGFPKGRRNYKEKDLECALREFEEETGYSKKNVILIKNLNPYEELFTGSNLKSYKHKYFIAMMKYEDTHEMNFQKSEIGDMRWFSYEDALDKIRDYNIEKKELIVSLHTLLKNSMIY
jgi:ADP-ribose pyrophosphatase YjhB (NUDIX family)